LSSGSGVVGGVLGGVPMALSAPASPTSLQLSLENKALSDWRQLEFPTDDN
jgi:hypothetical protein